jgi:hypothetical protein
MPIIPNTPLFPLDPNNYTGPTRQTSGIGRGGAVTPGTAYGEFARWLYVGTTGNVAVTLWDGVTVLTMPNMAAGIWHPVFSVAVNVTGTTATNLLWGS